MKKRSLLLAVLMIFPLLTGCKNEGEKLLKNYRKNVSVQKFVEKFKKKYEKTSYFKYIDYESGLNVKEFEEDLVFNSRTVLEEYGELKSGKHTLKETESVKTKENYQYDFDHKIVKATTKANGVEKNNDGEKAKEVGKAKSFMYETTKDEEEVLISTNEKTHFYSQNKKTQLSSLSFLIGITVGVVASEADNIYTMDVSEIDGDGNITEEETFESAAYTSLMKYSSKYYMDGNVFTYELMTEEDRTYKLEEGHEIEKTVSKNVEQFIFKKNSITLIGYQYSNQYIEHKDEEDDFTYNAGGYSSTEITIKFKNVNLKAPKLSKYIEEIDL